MIDSPVRRMAALLDDLIRPNGLRLVSPIRRANAVGHYNPGKKKKPVKSDGDR